MMKKLFRDKNFNHKLITLALPITLQNLMGAMVAAADTFMLCKFSQDAMAAVALATQVQFVQIVIVCAVVAGTSLMGAQYWGQKNIAVIEKLFGLCTRLSAVISIFFFAGCFFIPELLMKLFSSDPQLIRLGADYLRVVSLACIFSGLSQSHLVIMRISGHVKCSSAINIMAVLLNVTFNAIFIFGLFGLPAMGVKGAALATLLARFIELLVCIRMARQKNFIHLRLKWIFSSEKELIRDFRHYTLPIAGSLMLWGIGVTACTAIIGHLGKDAAAANAVVTATRNLLCCVCDGLAVGISIIIGNELGAGNLKKGRIYGGRAFAMSFLIGIAASVIILIAMPAISAAVNFTGEALSHLKGMFLVLAVYIIGRCANSVVINGIFSAGGDTLFNVYSIIVAVWCLALPLAFCGAFYFHWPVVAVYACTCLDEIAKLPWLISHYRKYKWVRNITR